MDIFEKSNYIVNTGIQSINYFIVRLKVDKLPT